MTAAAQSPALEVEHIAVRWVDVAELLDRDLRDSKLAAFVRGGWWRSTRRPIAHLRELLVRHHGVVVGVGTPVGEPEVFLGWLAAAPARNAVLHCWVKPLFRAPAEGYPSDPTVERLEEFRVGSSLALLCGIDFARPVLCLTWSPAAERIAAKPGNPYNLVRA